MRGKDVKSGRGTQNFARANPRAVYCNSTPLPSILDPPLEISLFPRYFKWCIPSLHPHSINRMICTCSTYFLCVLKSIPFCGDILRGGLPVNARSRGWLGLRLSLFYSRKVWSQGLLAIGQRRVHVSQKHIRYRLVR